MYAYPGKGNLKTPVLLMSLLRIVFLEGLRFSSSSISWALDPPKTRLGGSMWFSALTGGGGALDFLAGVPALLDFL
jgi:hypothetical protein